MLKEIEFVPTLPDAGASTLALTNESPGSTPGDAREPVSFAGGEKSPSEKTMRVPSKRALALGAVAIAALGFGANYGWHWWTEGRFVETTDNAYVRADVTLLAPKVAGYIATVAVKDNQLVQPGEVLFRIDDSDYRARVQQAEADIAARQAAIEGARSQLQLQSSVIAQTEADAKSAAAEDERAKADLDRYAQLVDRHAVSVQSYETARATAT